MNRTDTKKVSEKTLERRLIREVKKLGGKAVKFFSPFETGWPDRLVLLKGEAYWAELKTTGEELRPRQKVVRKELADLGFIVAIITDERDLAEFIAFIKNQKKPELSDLLSAHIPTARD